MQQFFQTCHLVPQFGSLYKEGFLRSETSLIQTIGRAARNVDGRVIMYADQMTDSMKRAIGETNRRRALQQKYNEENAVL